VPPIITPMAVVQPPAVIVAETPISVPVEPVEYPPVIPPTPSIPEPVAPPVETTPVQKVKAPPAPDVIAATPQETLYTVMPGDTLWKICIKAYGPDTAPSMISRVMSRNKIVSDIKLLWGKTIILPPPKPV